MAQVKESSQLPPLEPVSERSPSAVGSSHSPWGGGSCAVDPASRADARAGAGYEGQAAFDVRITSQEDQSAPLPSGSDVHPLALSGSILSRQSGDQSSMLSLYPDSDAQPAFDQRLSGGQNHIDEAEFGPVSGEAFMVSATPMACPPPPAGLAIASTTVVVQESPKEVTNMLTVTVHDNNASDHSTSSPTVIAMTNLSALPNEVLLQILGYLDVCDLLSTSRVSSDLFISLHEPDWHRYWSGIFRDQHELARRGGITCTGPPLFLRVLTATP